jgi:hypothetical protein
MHIIGVIVLHMARFPLTTEAEDFELRVLRLPTALPNAQTSRARVYPRWS